MQGGDRQGTLVIDDEVSPTVDACLLLQIAADLQARVRQRGGRRVRSHRDDDASALGFAQLDGSGADAAAGEGGGNALIVIIDW